MICKNRPLLVTYLLLFVTGCHSQKTADLNLVSATPAEAPSINLSAGSWADGQEYGRIQSALDKSNANIRLDFHQGIQWYNCDGESWEALSSIAAIPDRLKTVSEKSLVCIRTGKASWDKEAEYIQRISEFARQLEFDVVVVTTDHSSAIVISQVIQLKP